MKVEKIMPNTNIRWSVHLFSDVNSPELIEKEHKSDFQVFAAMLFKSRIRYLHQPQHTEIEGKLT